MNDNKIYWTMKKGEKIEVDQMTESHLRNTLKLIIKRSEKVQRINLTEQNTEPSCDDWMWK